MLRALALTVAILTGAPAMAQDALSWMRAQTPPGSTLTNAGSWAAPTGRLYATDPLTLGQTSTALNVPTTTAQVLGLVEPDQGRTASLALVWSDAPIVCGDDLGWIGVDSGLAGFLTPKAVAAVEKIARIHGNSYAGDYAEQLETKTPTPATIIDLPGARFPVAGSGWGDGGYPVIALYGAEHDIIALITIFIPKGDAWPLPPSCDADPNT